LASVLYAGEEQVGLARIVTDRATFARLCDAFVVPAQGGNGVERLHVRTVTGSPELGTLQILLLAARGVHRLYEEIGRFHALANPERWTVRRFDSGPTSALAGFAPSATPRAELPYLRAARRSSTTCSAIE